MKVTVNITSQPKGLLIDVAQSYTLVDSNMENRTLYVNLGQFANGSTTEVDDILVTQYGATPEDTIVGEPLVESKSKVTSVETVSEEGSN